MRNEYAQPLVKTWLKHAADGTPWTDATLPPGGAEFAASNYTDPKHLAREQQHLFHARPHVVALSADLPEPGSFVTRDQFSIPLLISRGQDGLIRAMANVCAHRGTEVVGDARGCTRRHVCDYHAWTYDDMGTLVGIPSRESFRDVEVPGPGLMQVPMVEKHGVIWAMPGVLAPQKGSALGSGSSTDLGVIGDDFDHFNIDSYEHWRSHRFDLEMNWKLVVDTFLEPYHFASLHKKTVAPIFFPNLCVADRHGSNVRHMVPRRSIAELADQPPDSWDLVPHSALVYLLFPATVFVMQIDHIEVWRVWPQGDNPGRAWCDLDFYIPTAPQTESSERHWENNWKLTIDTVEREDFRAMASMQRGLESGAIQRVRFGANEPALIMYHQALADELQASEAAG